MHRRFALRALAATPLLAAGTGCALKQVHLEERNFLPNAPTALIDEGIRRVNVALKVEDDVLLHGWHLQHPQPRALLIDFLGNGDNVLAYAGQIHEIAQHFQVDVLALDYRGSGARWPAWRCWRASPTFPMCVRASRLACRGLPSLSSS